jgi:hypothetical protein
MLLVHTFGAISCISRNVGLSASSDTDGLEVEEEWDTVNL